MTKHVVEQQTAEHKWSKRSCRCREGAWLLGCGTTPVPCDTGAGSQLSPFCFGHHIMGFWFTVSVPRCQMLLEEFFPSYHWLPGLWTMHFLSDQRAHQCIGFWATAQKARRKQTLGSSGISGSSLITSAPLAMAGEQRIYSCQFMYTNCIIYTVFHFNLVGISGKRWQDYKMEKQRLHTPCIIKWLGIDGTSKFSPYESILEKIYKLEKVKQSPTAGVPNIFFFFLFLLCFCSTTLKHIN